LPSVNCLIPDDVINFKVNCQPLEICCSQDEIQSALDVALDMAVQFTEQKWCPEEQCIIFPGNGRNKLFLIERTSLWLNEIDSITETDCNGHEHEWDIESIENHRHWLESEVCFPCNSKFRICGTWGKEIPPGLKRGIIMLALEILMPGSSGISNPGGITRSTWEDFSISYRVDDTFRELRPTTGYREIDNIFMNYLDMTSHFGMSVVPNNDMCFTRNCGKVSRNPNCGDGSCG
jgi:hypothetical protein